MKFVKKNATMVVAGIGVFLLILDARSTIVGAQEGVQLCIQTIIPSLFPFFVICGYFCNVFAQTRLSILRPILRLCKIPDGADGLFVIGMLGGYPVGAKGIADAYRDDQINKADAMRMLGFCSNAGPAFVFGIIGAYFNGFHIPWIVLGILIASAVLTGILLPQTNSGNRAQRKIQRISFVKVFQGSLIAISSVCGWVILFRVLISVLKQWILWVFPLPFQTMLIGFLELSNGCLALNMIANDGLRFIICVGFLSLGGLCVYLQTISVVGELGVGQYFPGKILQTSIALIISVIMQYILFPPENRVSLTLILVPIMLLTSYYIVRKTRNKKKTVAIPKELVYNTIN